MIRVLSHLMTLAIPALLATLAYLVDARRVEADAAWERYLAALPEDAPECARDRSGRRCVCADFTRRIDAEAYADAAARASGRMFGLDFDGDGAVCEHLP